jgi:hypothetical protein
LGSKRNRNQRERDRELRRDEIVIPEFFGGVLGEWTRDEAYFQYLILRRLGWFGRLLALAALMYLLWSLLGPYLGF